VFTVFGSSSNDAPATITSPSIATEVPRASDPMPSVAVSFAVWVTKLPVAAKV
jgi:hypothetical protein